MNYKQVIEQISNNSTFNKKDIKSITDSFLEIISNSVSTKEELNIPYIKIIHRVNSDSSSQNQIKSVIIAKPAK